MHSIPTIPHSFVFKNFLSLINQRHEFFKACSDDYGPCIRLKTPGRDFILLTDPELIKIVMQTRRDNFKKSFDVKIVRELLGMGPITTDGNMWQESRRAVLSSLHPSHLNSWQDKIETIIQREIPLKFHDGLWDIHPMMVDLSLKVLCEILFHLNLDSSEIKKILHAFEISIDAIEERLFQPSFLHKIYKSSKWKDFLKQKKYLDQLILNWIIERKQLSEDTPKDLLTSITHLPQTDRWKQDQLITLLIAGHETSALVLTWAIHLLGIHQDWQEKARNDDQMLDLVLEETLRLYPPVWCLGREAIDDVSLGSHQIKSGDTIVISLYSVQRAKNLWSDPNDFNPNRFMSKSRIHPFQYFPFSGGPRFCAGETFARAELKIILKNILRIFRWKSLNRDKIELSAKISLRSKFPLQINAKKLT